MLSDQGMEVQERMNKLYETPEITITKFDVSKDVMAGGNEGGGDGWNAGGEGAESETTYDNPDLDLFG